MIKSMGSDPESAAMAPRTILIMQKEYLYSTTYELLGYLNIKKGVEGNDCLCVLLFLYQKVKRKRPPLSGPSCTTREDMARGPGISEY